MKAEGEPLRLRGPIESLWNVDLARAICAK